MSSESERAYQRAWAARKRRTNPEWRAERNAKGKKWRADNPEKVKAIRAANAEYAREYRAKNKEKMKAYCKARYAANRERFADQGIRNKYGIGLTDYARILAEQGGGCRICGAPQPNANRQQRFHIDHNHRTGRVRGLLCSECNIGLGKFKDSPELLEAARLYLKADTSENEIESLLGDQNDERSDPRDAKPRRRRSR